jgi:hypothetical protein
MRSRCMKSWLNLHCKGGGGESVDPYSLHPFDG